MTEINDGVEKQRLTKTQVKALKQLLVGRVNGKFMPITILQLVALGYVKKEMSVTGWHWMFAITDSGREAIATAEATP